MLNIIGNKKRFLSISALLVIGSWVSIGLFGLRLGRDFTGGSLFEFQQSKPVLERSTILELAKAIGVEDAQVTLGEEGKVLVRMKPLAEADHQKLLTSVQEAAVAKQPDVVIEETRFESIGPTVGAEMRTKAVKAIIYTLLAIVAYIAWAFRKVSKPVQSWKYGVVAIVALVHDISIPTGVFAVLGHVIGVEVDALFVTALLTILGFSVHDTIVVFDRIRENLLKRGGSNFEEITNFSVNETMARSVNTSLTTFLVLLALYFFGGDTTQYFVLALIIGIFFGTYSSIFVASPLLVLWNNVSLRKRR